MIGSSSSCIGLVNTSEFLTSRDARFMMLYGAVLRRCDTVIFGCKSQAREWTAKYRIPEQITKIVYNGVDKDYFSRSRVSAGHMRSDMAIESDALIIGCVAQLRPEKGHSMLLDAFDRLINQHGINAVLVIVGEGVERENLEAVVKSKRLSDRVRFLGRADDVRPYLAIFDVFVMPSIGVEVFSNAMLEAMAMGVPVVSSDVGGSSEMIEHERDGYIYPRNNLTLLTEYLLRLTTNAGLANDFGNRARRKVEDMFTLDRMDNEYIATIRSANMLGQNNV
jgi:glycosyltransferase involved in cell wall biosynthesis